MLVELWVTRVLAMLALELAFTLNTGPAPGVTAVAVTRPDEPVPVAVALAEPPAFGARPPVPGMPPIALAVAMTGTRLVGSEVKVMFATAPPAVAPLTPFV